jgi:hypothetical protein
MATTNFTIRQGETWSKVLNLEDSDCIPTMVADSNSNPEMYFAGMATKTGQNSVPIYFKYGEVETKTHGRGKGRKTTTGIYDIIAYIPADEVGSCSVADKLTKVSCLSAAGTWTVNTSASLLTTSKMAEGDWNYEIRKGEASDVSGAELSETLLYGVITVEESSLDLSPGSSFTFLTPT